MGQTGLQEQSVTTLWSLLRGSKTTSWTGLPSTRMLSILHSYPYTTGGSTETSNLIPSEAYSQVLDEGLLTQSPEMSTQT